MLKRWILFLFIFCKAFSSNAPGTLPEQDIRTITYIPIDFPIELQQDILLKTEDLRNIINAVKIDPEFSWEKAQYIMNFVRKIWWTKFSEKQKQISRDNFINIFLYLIKRFPNKLDEIIEFMISMNPNIYNTFFTKIEHLVQQLNRKKLSIIGLKLKRLLKKDKQIINNQIEQIEKQIIYLKTLQNLEEEKRIDIRLKQLNGLELLKKEPEADFYELINQPIFINTQDENGNTALIKAAQNNNFEQVTNLISHNADTNVQNKNGFTALIISSFNGNNDINQILLSHNANPELQDKNGNTALITATIQGNAKIVQMLLTHRANPNVQNNGGLTALMFACNKGFTEIAKNLLKYNANPNLQDKKGITALMLAANKGYVAMVKTLIEHKADPNIKEMKGVTALRLAQSKYSKTKDQKYFDIINLLEPITNS